MPVLWWRSVGSTHTAYAVEAFLDEVAEAAGKDPVALRLELLKDHPRHAGVLRLAAEKAELGPAAAQGSVPRRCGREVVQDLRGADCRGDRQTTADSRRSSASSAPSIAGWRSTRTSVRAQMEGGIGFGLGAVMKSRRSPSRAAPSRKAISTATTCCASTKCRRWRSTSCQAPNGLQGVGEPGVPPDRAGGRQRDLRRNAQAHAHPPVLARPGRLTSAPTSCSLTAAVGPLGAQSAT